jgi:DNA-binding HxlR family transcriptional regulator
MRRKQALFCASKRKHTLTEIDPRMRQAIGNLVREMDRHGRERDGPVRALSAYVGDRWSSLILLVLEIGTWRHAELKRTLSEISHEGAISQRVLTLKLRSMERDGLVERTISRDVPPKVSYALSAEGYGLVSHIRGVIDWINSQSEKIAAARQRFDALADD